jgi:hypothetical protein
MSRIYFHIGLHKTASTWLQTRLFPGLEGVKLFRTRDLEQLDLSGGRETVIVSHEGLSGALVPKHPGERTARLEQDLKQIESLAPDRAIIVGFREHKSWLQSAHAQKAKKGSTISRAQYVSSFSLRDLQWCEMLTRLEQSTPAVFPFLFEELVSDPKSLVSDLCRFLGKKPPANIEALLRDPVGWSPKGRVGQAVTSSLYKRVWGSYRHNLKVKRRLYKLGMLFDRYFTPSPMPIDFELITALSRDWTSLLVRIGDRRGRNFDWARLRPPSSHS